MGTYVRATVTLDNVSAYGIGIGQTDRYDAVNRAAFAVLNKTR